PDLLMFTDGVDALARNAMPGLSAAVLNSGPVFAGLQVLLADTGTGVSDFFGAISTGAPSAGALLGELGGALRDLLGFAGNLLTSLATDFDTHFGQVRVLLHSAEDTILGLAHGAVPALSGGMGG